MIVNLTMGAEEVFVSGQDLPSLDYLRDYFAKMSSPFEAYQFDPVFFVSIDCLSRSSLLRKLSDLSKKESFEGDFIDFFDFSDLFLAKNTVICLSGFDEALGSTLVYQKIHGKLITDAHSLRSCHSNLPEKYRVGTLRELVTRYAEEVYRFSHDSSDWGTGGASGFFTSVANRAVSLGVLTEELVNYWRTNFPEEILPY